MLRTHRLLTMTDPSVLAFPCPFILNTDWTISSITYAHWIFVRGLFSFFFFIFTLFCAHGEGESTGRLQRNSNGDHGQPVRWFSSCLMSLVASVSITHPTYPISISNRDDNDVDLQPFSTPGIVDKIADTHSMVWYYESSLMLINQNIYFLLTRMNVANVISCFAARVSMSMPNQRNRATLSDMMCWTRFYGHFR